MLYTKYDKLYLKVSDMDAPATVIVDGKEIKGVFEIDCVTRTIHFLLFDAEGHAILDVNREDVLTGSLQCNELEVTAHKTGKVVIKWGEGQDLICL